MLLGEKYEQIWGNRNLAKLFYVEPSEKRFISYDLIWLNESKVSLFSIKFIPFHPLLLRYIVSESQIGCFGFTSK